MPQIDLQLGSGLEGALGLGLGLGLGPGAPSAPKVTPKVTLTLDLVAKARLGHKASPVNMHHQALSPPRSFPEAKERKGWGLLLA